MDKKRVLVLCVLFLSAAHAAPGQAACSAEPYWAGAAQEDITGPIAEVGFLGYADLGQVGQGLHMRLRSRTLVVTDSCRDHPVALVLGDLGMVFYGLKRQILADLGKELPGVFSDTNLLFSATHTHSGPGGFAHHALYNITTLGYSGLAFAAIRNGTVKSIVKAYQNLEPARLFLGKGPIAGTQFNRSPSAYARNAQQERNHYPADHDREMVLLSVFGADKKPIASFNWFGIHPVSLPMNNRLVSGDNKGLAAYLFEREMGTTYRRQDDFIAGFVQESAGDISPYALSELNKADRSGISRNRDAAVAQAAGAMRIFAKADLEISGPVQAVHRFVNLRHHMVDAAYTDGHGPQTTCTAALGVSFAAGTENGQPLKVFKEGTIWGVNWPRITLMPDEQRCHGEKVILLPTGAVKPDPWTAEVAPFQLIRIGSLAIIAAPFEITTMAGRRLRAQILDTLRDAGIETVVISSLANEYLHYVTTREEYAAQAYEGGSNLYGPWSLAAYAEIFTGLSSALKGETVPADDAVPLDLSHKQITLRPGVVWDRAPSGKEFGSVALDAASEYRAGEEVKVTFWGGHPNNSIAAGFSYLNVEQKRGAGFTPIRFDWDPDTTFEWRRVGLAYSQNTVRWEIPLELTPGSYRICHQGAAKPLIGPPRSYRGCSREFLIQAQPAG